MGDAGQIADRGDAGLGKFTIGEHVVRARCGLEGRFAGVSLRVKHADRLAPPVAASSPPCPADLGGDRDRANSQAHQINEKIFSNIFCLQFPGGTLWPATEWQQEVAPPNVSRFGLTISNL